MREDLLLKNYNMIHYNERIVSSLESLCTPLFNNFPITHFSYARGFPDGRFLLLSPSKNWQERWITTIPTIEGGNFQKEIWQAPLDKFSSYIWYNIIGSHFLNQHDPMAVINHEFRLSSMLDIFLRSENHVEVWSFGTKLEHMEASQLFQHYTDLFIYFCIYFKEKASSLINALNSAQHATFGEKVDLYTKREVLDDQKINKFLEEIQIKKLSFGVASEKCMITRQEVRCLAHLATGKSIKEVALLIRISPRTVESYIENLKNKTGCSRTTELINKILESNLSPILSYLRL
ncbi:MAG: helix-turn-helix transcriptional regulator [Alphaproteobacteria bacterium]|nr:helix-turn-helix transcriptional regulator [Alphaproteobacteria bacterium]